MAGDILQLAHLSAILMFSDLLNGKFKQLHRMKQTINQLSFTNRQNSLLHFSNSPSLGFMAMWLYHSPHPTSLHLLKILAPDSGVVTSRSLAIVIDSIHIW